MDPTLALKPVETLAEIQNRGTGGPKIGYVYTGRNLAWWG